MTQIVRTVHRLIPEIITRAQMHSMTKADKIYFMRKVHKEHRERIVKGMEESKRLLGYTQGEYKKSHPRVSKKMHRMIISSKASLKRKKITLAKVSI